MQGVENSAESKLDLAMARQLYPGKCGYSSETRGIMKNLRESTTNSKVRKYHKEFYRPENLKVVITGQVKPDDVFRALEKLENKIVSKVCCFYSKIYNKNKTNSFGDLRVLENLSKGHGKILYLL